MVKVHKASLDASIQVALRVLNGEDVHYLETNNARLVFETYLVTTDPPSPLPTLSKGRNKMPAPYKDPENTLLLNTTKGLVVIEMRPDLAPNHVAHIKKLVREGFYDGIVFHRVIDAFMAQTGDPTGTGTGGSKYPNLKQEFNGEPHTRGVVSMARAQNPDSGNSQFFICFADARFLDRQYTVWGKVVEGMESIDALKRGEPVRNPDAIVTASIAADVPVAAA